MTLARFLNDASALPQVLMHAPEKRRYLKGLMDRHRSREKKTRFLDYATRAVRSGLTPGGGYYGIWCRDASYVVDAMIALGLTEDASRAVKRIWSSQITEEGSKLLFGRGSPERKFRVGVAKTEQLHGFRSALPTSIHQGFSEVYALEPDIDSTALIVSSTCKLCLSSKSNALFDFVSSHLERAMQFLEKRDRDGDGLLEQGANEDWMDSVMRSGKVVYSQGVWLEALKQWSLLLRSKGRSTESDRVLDKAEDLVRKVDSSMFNGSCYADENSEHTNQDVVIYINARSIRDSRADLTLETLGKRLHNSPLGPSVVSPHYSLTGPLHLKSNEYQNGAFWPWISSCEVLALSSTGRVDEALDLMWCCLEAAALEWIDTSDVRRSGRFPFRTGLAACLNVAMKLNISA